jgi:hypothetical protein
VDQVPDEPREQFQDLLVELLDPVAYNPGVVAPVQRLDEERVLDDLPEHGHHRAGVLAAAFRGTRDRRPGSGARSGPRPSQDRPRPVVHRSRSAGGRRAVPSAAAAAAAAVPRRLSARGELPKPLGLGAGPVGGRPGKGGPPPESLAGNLRRLHQRGRSPRKPHPLVERGRRRELAHEQRRLPGGSRGEESGRGVVVVVAVAAAALRPPGRLLPPGSGGWGGAIGSAAGTGTGLGSCCGCGIVACFGGRHPLMVRLGDGGKIVVHRSRRLVMSSSTVVHSVTRGTSNDIVEGSTHGLSAAFYCVKTSLFETKSRELRRGVAANATAPATALLSGTGSRQVRGRRLPGLCLLR